MISKFIAGVGIFFGTIGVSFFGPFTSTRVSFLLLLIVFLEIAFKGYPIPKLSRSFLLFLIALIFAAIFYTLTILVNYGDFPDVFGWFFYILWLFLAYVILNAFGRSKIFLSGFSIVFFLFWVYVVSELIFLFISVDFGFLFRSKLDEISEMGLNEFLYQIIASSLVAVMLCELNPKFFFSKFIKNAAFFMLFICFLLALLSLSRQVLLIFILFGSVFVFKSKMHIAKKGSIAVVFVVVISGIFIQMNNSDSFSRLVGKRLSYVMTGIGNASDNTRGYLYDESIKHAFQEPFLGIGPGNFEKIFNKGVESGYLQIMVEIGLLPGLIFILMYITVVLSTIVTQGKENNDFSNLSNYFIAVLLLVGPFFNEVLRDPVTMLSLLTLIYISSMKNSVVLYAKK